jgi:hypothetical protein
VAAAPDVALDAEIGARLAAGETTRAIAARLSLQFGIPRRAVYARALAIREQAGAKASPP